MIKRLESRAKQLWKQKLENDLPSIDCNVRNRDIVLPLFATPVCLWIWLCWILFIYIVSTLIIIMRWILKLQPKLSYKLRRSWGQRQLVGKVKYIPILEYCVKLKKANFPGRVYFNLTQFGQHNPINHNVKLSSFSCNDTVWSGVTCSWLYQSKPHWLVQKKGTLES